MCVVAAFLGFAAIPSSLTGSCAAGSIETSSGGVLVPAFNMSDARHMTDGQAVLVVAWQFAHFTIVTVACMPVAHYGLQRWDSAVLAPMLAV